MAGSIVSDHLDIVVPAALQGLARPYAYSVGGIASASRQARLKRRFADRSPTCRGCIGVTRVDVWWRRRCTCSSIVGSNVTWGQVCVARDQATGACGETRRVVAAARGCRREAECRCGSCVRRMPSSGLRPRAAAGSSRRAGCGRRGKVWRGRSGALKRTLRGYGGLPSSRWCDRARPTGTGSLRCAGGARWMRRAAWRATGPGRAAGFPAASAPSRAR